MKTFRFNVFETNSSSTHAIAIVSGKKWDEFENGNGLYSVDWETMLTSDELYDRFLNGDQDGDYYSEKYEAYLNQNTGEKLTREEFGFIVQNKHIAVACYNEAAYKIPADVQDKIAIEFGENTHLNREVIAIIGEWFSYYGMYSYNEFDNYDSTYAISDTIEGVRVVAYGYYSEC